MDESRAFAFGEYLTALAKGNRMTAAERKTVAQKLARLTGLSVDYVERTNLRVDPARFRRSCCATGGWWSPPRRPIHIGRARRAGEDDEFDLSNSALQGPYTALFQDYVKNDLKWESDLHYPTSATCVRGAGTSFRTNTWT